MRNRMADIHPAIALLLVAEAEVGAKASIG
jgi:hypothetical protein